MTVDPETALLVRLEATVAKFEKQMARSRKVGADSAQFLENRFGQTNRRISKSAEESAQAIGREMDRLRAKYDPVFAASKRYETALDDLNRAHRLGAVPTQQYEAALERLNEEYQRTAIASQRGANSTAQFIGGLSGGSRRLSGFTSVMRNSRNTIQNASFQIADFAVQVSNGTSAAVAFGQQAPQLLGAFGAIGAVIGAVVAVGVPLGAMLLRNSESASELEDRLKSLNDVLSDVTKGTDILTLSADELARRYGDAAEKVRGLVIDQLRFLRIEAEASMREALESVASLSEEYSRTRLVGEGPFEEPTESIEESLKRLQEEFDVTETQARMLFAAFERLSSAVTFEEQESAMQNLVNHINDLRDRGLGRVPTDINEMILGFTKTQITVEELRAQLDNAEDAANDIASTSTEINFDGATASAAMLAKQLEVTLGTARAIADQLSSNARAPGLGPGSGGGAITVDEDVRFARPTLGVVSRAEVDRRNRPRSRSGGGGGLSEEQKRYNDLIREGVRLTAEMRTQAELYADEVDRLNELLAAGAINQETYDRAMNDLSDRFGKVGAAAQQAGELAASGIDRMMNSILSRSGDAVDAVRAILAEIAKLSAYQSLAALAPNVFGSNGLIPLLPNAKGNAFMAGRVVPHAAGGVVNVPTLFPMSGSRTGLMGEAGPEAILPLKRIRGRLGVEASAGGAPEVNIQVVQNIPAEVSVSRSGKDIRILVDEYVEASISSGRGQRALRREFGLRKLPGGR